MKTKRTMLSMIVVLSIFYLSVIFISHRNTDLPLENRSTAVDSLQTTANSITTASETPLLQSFSYASSTSPVLKSTKEESEKMITNVQSQSIDNAEADQTLKDAASENHSTNNPTDTTPAVTEVFSTNRKEPDTLKALYSNIGISIANSFVKIRESASTDSDVLGKLYKNSAAKILDTEGDWYYVESGSVTGYVSSEFIQAGIPDDEIVEKYGMLSILVKVDGLNVRKDPRTESDIVTVIYMNEVYPILDLQEEWIKVDIKDDKKSGYVKKEYANLIVDFEDAVSKEEELELLRLQEEKRVKKETEVKYRDELNYSEGDLKLLACLVHSEAGNQSYEGKLAVANIVLNRVKSSKYPDTIKDVIYQPGQFTVATSGSLAKQIAGFNDYSSNSQRLTIKAAKAALEGANNIGSRLYFHSYESAVKEGYDHKSNCVKLDNQLYW